MAELEELKGHHGRRGRGLEGFSAGEAADGAGEAEGAEVKEAFVPVRDRRIWLRRCVPRTWCLESMWPCSQEQFQRQHQLVTQDLEKLQRDQQALSKAWHVVSSWSPSRFTTTAP